MSENPLFSIVNSPIAEGDLEKLLDDNPEGHEAVMTEIRALFTGGEIQGQSIKSSVTLDDEQRFLFNQLLGQGVREATYSPFDSSSIVLGDDEVTYSGNIDFLLSNGWTVMLINPEFTNPDYSDEQIIEGRRYRIDITEVFNEGKLVGVTHGEGRIQLTFQRAKQDHLVYSGTSWFLFEPPTE